MMPVKPMKMLSPRAAKLLRLLQADPKKKWTFADIAEVMGTTASGAVSMIRSIARVGYFGDFRDRVMGERAMFDPETCKARAKGRKHRAAYIGGRT